MRHRREANRISPRLRVRGHSPFPLTGAGVQAAPADVTVGVAPTAPPLPAGMAESLFFPMDAVVRVAGDHPVAATVERVMAAVHTAVATVAAAEAGPQGAFRALDGAEPSALLCAPGSGLQMLRTVVVGEAPAAPPLFNISACGVSRHRPLLG